MITFWSGEMKSLYPTKSQFSFVKTSDKIVKAELLDGQIVVNNVPHKVICSFVLHTYTVKFLSEELFIFEPQRCVKLFFGNGKIIAGGYYIFGIKDIQKLKETFEKLELNSKQINLFHYNIYRIATFYLLTEVLPFEPLLNKIIIPFIYNYDYSKYPDTIDRKIVYVYSLEKPQPVNLKKIVSAKHSKIVSRIRKFSKNQIEPPVISKFVKSWAIFLESLLREFAKELTSGTFEVILY